MSSATAVKAAQSVSRSDYVSRLRRAFLLRAHPDRFRSQSISIRKGQAEIIQAVSERLTASDVTAYTSSSSHEVHNNKIHQNQEWKTHKYYLQKKDGSLHQHKISLNGNVDNILTGLFSALKSSGLTNISPPPPSPTIQNGNNGSSYEEKFEEKFGINQHQSTSSSTSTINSAFDINTRRGRNLTKFLESLDLNEIESRKRHRLDASAAALVARQAYKFQSIDGTSLGWSSASLAQCLTMLTKAHDEHHSKFKVESFYPLRLIMNNDEHVKKLDLYGGNIMLNPASTQSQWLDTLMLVTEDSLDELNANRIRMKEFTDHVQNALNVKFKKGYSCSSSEYYELMQRLFNSFQDFSQDDDASISSNALAMDRITIVVETDQAARQPIVLREGHIRISAGMPVSTIISATSKFRADAVRKLQEDSKKMERAKELVSLVKHELGLNRVIRVRLSSITNDNFITGLESFLYMDSDIRSDFKESMAGQTMSICGSGQYCHLGDDGSIMVPWDWK